MPAALAAAVLRCRHRPCGAGRDWPPGRLAQQPAGVIWVTLAMVGAPPRDVCCTPRAPPAAAPSSEAQSPSPQRPRRGQLLLNTCPQGEEQLPGVAWRGLRTAGGAPSREVALPDPQVVWQRVRHERHGQAAADEGAAVLLPAHEHVGLKLPQLGGSLLRLHSTTHSVGSAQHSTAQLGSTLLCLHSSATHSAAQRGGGLTPGRSSARLGVSVAQRIAASAQHLRGRVPGSRAGARLLGAHA